MSDWATQIESDLKWREGEIASLKLLAASFPADSNRQRALLRALWAMLYAQYEVFCKFCWDLFLTAIESEGPARKELRETNSQVFASESLQDTSRQFFR